MRGWSDARIFEEDIYASEALSDFFVEPIQVAPTRHVGADSRYGISEPLRCISELRTITAGDDDAGSLFFATAGISSGSVWPQRSK